jgi:hypothetical protein
MIGIIVDDLDKIEIPLTDLDMGLFFRRIKQVRGKRIHFTDNTPGCIHGSAHTGNAEIQNVVRIYNGIIKDDLDVGGLIEEVEIPPFDIIPSASVKLLKSGLFSAWFASRSPARWGPN